MANATIWSAQIRAGDVVRDPCADATNAPIAQEDVAAVAARALLDDAYAGRSLVLTGPETLSRREKVERIGQALGRDLRYVEVSRDEGIALFEPTMGTHAAWYVDGLAASLGHGRPPEPTVAEVTGRPAMTYLDWTRRHADLFR